MLRHLRQNIFFFIGLIIGLGTSIFLWLIGQDNISTFTLGLSVTIVGLLIDILLQGRQQEDRLTSLLNIERDLINDQWLYPKIVSITSNYYAALNMRSPLLLKKARSVIECCYQDMHDLGRGTYYIPIEQEKQENIEAIRSAQQSFKATSYVDKSWWQSNSGKNYFEENKLAIKRGCNIDRVFIIKDQTELNEIKDVIDEQMKAGVNIWTVQINILPPHMQEDFIICDDNLVSISEVTRDGIPKRVLISIDPWFVSKYVSIFENITLISEKGSN